MGCEPGPHMRWYLPIEVYLNGVIRYVQYSTFSYK
jgi:hypothetical protein